MSRSDAESKEDVDMSDAADAQTTDSGAPAAGATAPSSSTKRKATGKKKEVEVPEVDPNYDGQRFHIGELIYANYAEGKQWFEAKVLKIEKRAGSIYYYLHYQGWSDKYNDWRPYAKDNELLKHDEEGKKVFDDAKLKLKDSTKGGKKTAASSAEEATKKKSNKRKHDGEEEADDDVQVGGAHGEVKLKISGFLKKQLIADWESVTRQHKLVTLPRPITVHALLQEFEASKPKQESSHQMVKEVIHGLEQYFEKALGTVLLYRFERPQYKAQLAKATAATAPMNQLSHVYGAEHLLRLFVKLPSLLAYTKLETKEAVVLGAKLNDFIKWLDKKAQGAQGLFQAEYEATDKDYAQLVQEAAE